jgi:hypothetical protein
MDDKRFYKRALLLHPVCKYESGKDNIQSAYTVPKLKIQKFIRNGVVTIQAKWTFMYLGRWTNDNIVLKPKSTLHMRSIYNCTIMLQLQDHGNFL